MTCNGWHRPTWTSRRDVRRYTQWSVTQVRVHLDRLQELEYIIVHHGGRGHQHATPRRTRDELGRDQHVQIAREFGAQHRERAEQPRSADHEQPAAMLDDGAGREYRDIEADPEYRQQPLQLVRLGKSQEERSDR